METRRDLVEPRKFRSFRGLMVSLRIALVTAGALGLSAVSPRAFGDPMNVRSLASTGSSDARARTIPRPQPADPAESQALITGFIPIDHASQPHAGNTQIQVPSLVTNQEVEGEYGFGLALLVLGVLLTTAVLLGLFMVVTRRTWDSNHPPESQRRFSE